MMDGDIVHKRPISHAAGRARDAEIARVGLGHGWVWVALPDRRRAMPVEMLREFGFEFALEADAGATRRAAGANKTNTSAVLSTPTITAAIRSMAISNAWLMFCRAGAAISAGVKPASAIPK